MHHSQDKQPQILHKKLSCAYKERMVMENLRVRRQKLVGYWLRGQISDDVMKATIIIENARRGLKN